MRVVRGTFQGTGAVLYLGIGFMPRSIKLRGLTDATDLYQTLEFEKEMRSTAKGFEGLSLALTGDIHTKGLASDLATTAGISLYRGGDAADGTETYLIKDPHPNKVDKGVGAEITAWTSDVVASRSGHWNDVCSLTYPDTVGLGSIINISGKEYVCTTVTSNGEVAGEVILDVAAPSGNIGFLGGMYTYVQAPVGTIMPAGIKLSLLTVVNVNAELISFEAYDE